MSRSRASSNLSDTSLERIQECVLEGEPLFDEFEPTKKDPAVVAQLARAVTPPKELFDIWTKLKPAPSWCSALSLLAYSYLLVRGLRHVVLGVAKLPDSELRGDVLRLSLLYLVESAIALVTRRTTMIGWRTMDFLAHHLPYALVSGSFVFWYPDGFASFFRRTLALSLMTSLNEAHAAASALGLPQRMGIDVTLNICNRVYLLMLMLVMVITESSEIIGALVSPGTVQPIFVRVTAMLTLGAPGYHTLVVIPACLSYIKKALRKLKEKKRKE